MFGRRFEGVVYAGHVGWRAIFHPHAHNPIDILPDRGSRNGDDATADEIIKWLNAKNDKLDGKKPWRWLQKQSKNLSASSSDYVQFIDGDFILEASPQSSYGYLYIGAAKVTEWKDDFEPGVPAGITRFDSAGKRIDSRSELDRVPS